MKAQENFERNSLPHREAHFLTQSLHFKKVGFFEGIPLPSVEPHLCRVEDVVGVEGAFDRFE